MPSETISFNETKFRELLLYIAEKSVGDPNFGKTKLNKILFYVDFLAYGKFGKPLTGATYQRRPYGPVPKQIVEARTALTESGQALVEVADRFGRRQDRLIAKRPPNLSVFSVDEKSHVDEVIGALWDHTGVEVSEMSHKELGWRIAKDRQEIPYETVFLSCRRLTPQDVKRAQEVHALLMPERA